MGVKAPLRTASRVPPKQAIHETLGSSWFFLLGTALLLTNVSSLYAVYWTEDGKNPDRFPTFLVFAGTIATTLILLYPYFIALRKPAFARQMLEQTGK